MSTTRKIALGLGLAGGALLAAYLLTGDRKQKTLKVVSKAGKRLKDVLNAKEKRAREEQDVHYV